MANAVYPVTKKAALDAILATGTPKAILVDTALYTYSAAHDFLADIAAGARVGSAVTLTSVTTTDGVFNAAPVSFTGLTAAPTIEALAIYVDTGSEATSRVLCYIDSAPACRCRPGRRRWMWHGAAARTRFSSSDRGGG